VPLFGWPGRSRAEPLTWRVAREGDSLYIEPSRGRAFRVPVEAARAVRIVPLTGGDHHMQGRGGWQVALQRTDGDVLVGSPVDDWRLARALAQQVCDAANLRLDELTAKMFSRVGDFGPNTSRS
jgi:hypothetical protein